MADLMTKEQRSRCMSNIKEKNTGPELLLRKALWKYGCRYQLKNKQKIPGRPDLIFSSAKVVVFIDGCFWHNCPIHGHTPKTNLEYWENKLERNRQRAEFVNEKLAEMGWLVLRFWEHEIEDDLALVVQKIAMAIKKGNVDC